MLKEGAAPPWWLDSLDLHTVEVGDLCGGGVYAAGQPLKQPPMAPAGMATWVSLDLTWSLCTPVVLR